MLIKEGNEGGGKSQSRENTEGTPQSSRGGFSQVRKAAHPKAVNN